ESQSEELDGAVEECTCTGIWRRIHLLEHAGHNEVIERKSRVLGDVQRALGQTGGTGFSQCPKVRAAWLPRGAQSLERARHGQQRPMNRRLARSAIKGDSQHPF
ncbi:hypothetical protein GOP47_0009003, partial [Adiantum capillus-veneris]